MRMLLAASYDEDEKGIHKYGMNISFPKIFPLLFVFLLISGILVQSDFCYSWELFFFARTFA